MSSGNFYARLYFFLFSSFLSPSQDKYYKQNTNTHSCNKLEYQLQSKELFLSPSLSFVSKPVCLCRVKKAFCVYLQYVWATEEIPVTLYYRTHQSRLLRLCSDATGHPFRILRTILALLERVQRRPQSGERDRAALLQGQPEQGLLGLKETPRRPCSRNLEERWGQSF